MESDLIPVKRKHGSNLHCGHARLYTEDVHVHTVVPVTLRVPCGLSWGVTEVYVIHTTSMGVTRTGRLVLGSQDVSCLYPLEGGKTQLYGGGHHTSSFQRCGYEQRDCIPDLRKEISMGAGDTKLLVVDWLSGTGAKVSVCLKLRTLGLWGVAKGAARWARGGAVRQFLCLVGGNW